MFFILDGLHTSLSIKEKGLTFCMVVSDMYFMCALQVDIYGT